MQACWSGFHFFIPHYPRIAKKSPKTSYKKENHQTYPDTLLSPIFRIFMQTSLQGTHPSIHFHPFPWSFPACRPSKPSVLGRWERWGGMTGHQFSFSLPIWLPFDRTQYPTLQYIFDTNPDPSISTSIHKISCFVHYIRKCEGFWPQTPTREPKLQRSANYQDPVHGGCTTNCFQAPSSAIHMDGHAIGETDAKVLIVLRHTEGTPCCRSWCPSAGVLKCTVYMTTLFRMYSYRKCLESWLLQGVCWHPNTWQLCQFHLLFLFKTSPCINWSNASLDLPDILITTFTATKGKGLGASQPNLPQINCNYL